MKPQDRQHKKTCKVREAADRGRDHENIIRDDSTVGRSAGFGYFSPRFLGFRCASPQALRRRPLCGLRTNVSFVVLDAVRIQELNEFIPK